MPDDTMTEQELAAIKDLTPEQLENMRRHAEGAGHVDLTDYGALCLINQILRLQTNAAELERENERLRGE